MEHKGQEMKTINQLCDIVRQNAYNIHCYHGTGFLEKVYENALAHRFRKAGLDVKQQQSLKVYDEDGTEIGEYFADLLVENSLIVELKAARTIADEHVAQILEHLAGLRPDIPLPEDIPLRIPRHLPGSVQQAATFHAGGHLVVGHRFGFRRCNGRVGHEGSPFSGPLPR